MLSQLLSLCQTPSCTLFLQLPSCILTFCILSREPCGLASLLLALLLALLDALLPLLPLLLLL